MDGRRGVALGGTYNLTAPLLAPATLLPPPSPFTTTTCSYTSALPFSTISHPPALSMLLLLPTTLTIAAPANLPPAAGRTGRRSGVPFSRNFHLCTPLSFPHTTHPPAVYHNIRSCRGRSWFTHTSYSAAALPGYASAATRAVGPMYLAAYLACARAHIRALTARWDGFACLLCCQHTRLLVPAPLSAAPLRLPGAPCRQQRSNFNLLTPLYCYAFTAAVPHA